MKTYNDWWKENSGWCANLNDAWDFATEQMQAKLDEQAKELEALRGFANGVLLTKRFSIDYDWIESRAKMHRLIDENGNPTPLLTGDK